ncbi:serine/threonine-protein kinase/endoribonuclease IRE1-like protein [Dinothrombium tinctorium]|uniref:non-specific serine/threonine protein kinase n=1 Tax=Dinothrombium tinctorium TaxID=1965070 RepID=A0A3S3PNF9_9ACAR|nr:serine/threonine-protein kinase/endoribonuclease IRE1-like protein [Dinothrombium tinctorium]RWS13318.1 serine/threonine-protein kinase/endoribonuclease IRE1-like protein [Dinothrombium tinctorium]RWS14311.1 serine/threonine-protein kinase/endoribonuclease IRE1-like protein [Dinothrombium tinctorium]RWS14315.1 serine/threonine-protein kinase/endoribonuclease IRE1-like protein [Dinothrombium tinctorium]
MSAEQPIAVIEPHLLISTLDGSLFAIGKRSGLIEWSAKEDSIVKLPSVPNITDKNQVKMPMFLPDPKDGCLYRYNGVLTDDRSSTGKSDTKSERDVLEKLPFTLSELISASPCRSSDGLLFVGKKVDSWITLNKETGEKLNVLSADSPTCPRSQHFNKKGEPVADDQILLVGKSEFHLSIFDLKTKEKRWNLTVVDYSNTAQKFIKQNKYDLLHLTSSKTGRIVTFDVTSEENEQKILWTHQLGSPIVSIYEYSDVTKYGQMIKVPFTTIGEDFSKPNATKFNKNLYPSLYIGETDSKSLYALTTLVDLEQTPILSSKIRFSSFPLLEGPNDGVETDRFDTKSFFNDFTYSPIYGFYEYPDYSKSEVIPQLAIAQLPKNNLITQKLPTLSEGIQNSIIANPTNDDPNYEYQHSALFILLTTLVVMFSISCVLWAHKRRKQQPKKNFSSENFLTVGKISVNTKEIIGRGSSGTCVYKGLFENKQLIAVKRVISDYFILADREIELLRSLQHPNLIRYFATESDNMFRYIAIELAETTLDDLVENGRNLDLDAISILEQSSNGLCHLHSLNVVHRDIKPANILISMPLPPYNRRKVMITDFGVSKVLNQDHTSTINGFSTTKVLNGTEGWIAPEVLLAKINKDANFMSSKPIDIFSLGCLFYYVLTNGFHPFGDPLERQANILKSQINLTKLTEEEEYLKSNLIETMISKSPSERPTIETILKHPIFWPSDKQLQFLQDVSDRLEKEAIDSESVRCLERGGFDVVKGDWKRHITIELQTDLRKFRSYKGNSVRDLLRAMRNKRHHYRELPPEVQLSLGSIPDEFLIYFTTRFPRLVIHTYIAFQSFKFEDIFKSYYDQDTAWDFQFPPLPKSGIRWYDGNRSPEKRHKAKTDNEIVLAPNGVISTDA